MSEEANKLLIDSALNNDIDGVKKALKQGADINFMSKWDSAPMHIAGSKGFTKLAKFLLDSGADSTLLDGTDYSPLHYAVRDGHIEVVKLLLDEGGPYTDRLLADAGIVASMSVSAHPAAGDLIRRQRVKQLKPEVDDHSNEDKMLFDAVYKGNNQEIEAALKKGANINSRDNRDLTILRWAVRRNHLETVKLLLGNKAEINAVSNMGWSALMEACMDGYTPIVEVLLSKGAKVNLTTVDNATALYFASYEGFTEIVKLLLDNGADPFVEVDISSGDYEQKDLALMAAIKNGHMEIARLLKKAMNLE